MILLHRRKHSQQQGKYYMVDIIIATVLHKTVAASVTAAFLVRKVALVKRRRKAVH
jgi:hypothetical protein